MIVGNIKIWIFDFKLGEKSALFMDTSTAIIKYLSSGSISGVCPDDMEHGHLKVVWQ
jgi:hypothetical protein